MARTNDEMMNRPTTDPAGAAVRRDEHEASGMDRREPMPTEPVVRGADLIRSAVNPIEPVMDVDEWLAEEAGYGYGV